MSYDLHLLIPHENENPVITARRGDGHNRPANAGSDAIQQKVAQALISSDPLLKVFQFDYEAIARSQGISPEEARAKFKHIEINDLQRNTGVQILVFGNESTVTVPYWHHGTTAQEVFKEIWNYLNILERAGGYVTYDPQLDRILDLSQDRDAVLSCYARVVNAPGATTSSTEAAQKPWWKVW